jgi:hypothetical protein
MINLNDSDLLLVLCINEEGLPNPADFAARLRASILAEPTTPEEIEAAKVVWDGLREEEEAARIAAKQLPPAEYDADWPFSG